MIIFINITILFNKHFSTHIFLLPFQIAISITIIARSQHNKTRMKILRKKSFRQRQNIERNRRFNGYKILAWLTTLRSYTFPQKTDNYILSKIEFRSIVQNDENNFIRKTAQCFNNHDYSELVFRLKNYIENNCYQELLPQTNKPIPSEINISLKTNLEKTNIFLKNVLSEIIQPIVLENYMQKYHRCKFTLLKLKKNLDDINLKLLANMHNFLYFQFYSIEKQTIEYKIMQEEYELYTYICKFKSQNSVLNTINKIVVLQTTIIENYCKQIDEL